MNSQIIKPYGDSWGMAKSNSALPCPFLQDSAQEAAKRLAAQMGLIMFRLSI